MFCVLLCVALCCSSVAVILMGKRELIALLGLSSWCLVVVGQLFLSVPQGCLQFVIVVFPDHTHLLFFINILYARFCGSVTANFVRILLNFSPKCRRY